MHLFGFLGLLFGLIGADAPDTPSIAPDGSAAAVGGGSAPHSTHPCDFPREPGFPPTDEEPGPVHPDEWEPESESKVDGDTESGPCEVFAVEAGTAGPGACARGGLAASRLRLPSLVARRC